MRSTYFLAGSPWDGISVSGRSALVVPFDPSMPEVGSEDNLFDLSGRRRFLRLSDFLSCNAEQEVLSLLARVEGCEQIRVAVDCFPLTSNRTIVSFYLLRVHQVLQVLHETFPCADVCLMEAEEMARSFRARYRTIPWLIAIAEQFVAYTAERGMAFNADGFPIVPKRSYADIVPRDMLPFSHRHSRLRMDSSDTAICFFMDDRRIYPRFGQVFDELAIYSEYAAVVVPDLTVTEDMDVAWQAFIMLLNQLFGAVLAVNGVKLIANSRCGSVESLRYLDAVPPGTLCASGSLGCDVLKCADDLGYVAKILKMRPMAVLQYGKDDPIALEQLASVGIPVSRYRDIHIRSRRESRLARAA